jgi:ribosomal protein S1
MKRMIARFYNCQGIKFVRDDELLEISNSEHGFGQPVVYEIRDTEIKDGKLSLSMKALEDVAAKEIEEEVFEIPDTEDVTTSLGSLLAGLKF